MKILNIIIFFILFINDQMESINIKKMQNNMLRVYVYTYPKQIRKGLFKKIKSFINNTNDNMNLLLMDVNAHYYSLSEEDRTLIETVISLSL